MSNKISGYTIATSEDYHELIDKVQEDVDKGWEPVGGVTVTRVVDSAGDETTLFLQALILPS